MACGAECVRKLEDTRGGTDENRSAIVWLACNVRAWQTSLSNNVHQLGSETSTELLFSANKSIVVCPVVVLYVNLVDVSYVELGRDDRR